MNITYGQDNRVNPKILVTIQMTTVLADDVGSQHNGRAVADTFGWMAMDANASAPAMLQAALSSAFETWPQD